MKYEIAIRYLFCHPARGGRVALKHCVSPCAKCAVDGDLEVRMNVVSCFDWLNPAKGMLLGMCQLWSHLLSHIAISDRQGDWREFISGIPLFRRDCFKAVLIKHVVDLEQVGYAVAKAEGEHCIFRDSRRKGIASRLQKAVGFVACEPQRQGELNGRALRNGPHRIGHYRGPCSSVEPCRGVYGWCITVTPVANISHEQIGKSAIAGLFNCRDVHHWTSSKSPNGKRLRANEARTITTTYLNSMSCSGGELSLPRIIPHSAASRVHVRWTKAGGG